MNAMPENITIFQQSMEAMLEKVLSGKFVIVEKSKIDDLEFQNKVMRREKMLRKMSRLRRAHPYIPAKHLLLGRNAKNSTNQITKIYEDEEFEAELQRRYKVGDGPAIEAAEAKLFELGYPATEEEYHDRIAKGERIEPKLYILELQEPGITKGQLRKLEW